MLKKLAAIGALAAASLIPAGPAAADGRPCTGMVDTDCWFVVNHREKSGYCTVYVNVGIVSACIGD